MLGDLRTNLWQAKCVSFDFENDLKIRMDIGSVFANVYDEVKQRLNKVSKSVVTEITNDLKRVYYSGGLVSPGQLEEFKQISTVLQCIAYIFP